MLTAICIVLIITIVAATWFLGLWNNFITLINLLLATMVASSFFEPLADLFEQRDPTYTYMLDFLCLWLLFFLTFGVLRLATDWLSRYRLKFNIWVEMIGRSVFSISIAWIFICFALFTLHTAPMPTGTLDFQPTPQAKNFILGPDRLWLAFVQSRSRGALAEFPAAPLVPEYDLRTHPDDQRLNARVFDPFSDFVFKYNDRRAKISEESQLRVFRPGQ